MTKTKAHTGKREGSEQDRCGFVLCIEGARYTYCADV